MEQARAAIAEALKLDPTLTLAAEIKRREENGLAPASVEHLRQALRKAGMPGSPQSRLGLPPVPSRRAGAGTASVILAPV